MCFASKNWLILLQTQLSTHLEDSSLVCKHDNFIRALIWCSEVGSLTLLLLGSPSNAWSSAFPLQNASNSHSRAEKNYMLKTGIQTKGGTPSVVLISTCVRADAGELSSWPGSAFCTQHWGHSPGLMSQYWPSCPTPQGKQWECCAPRDGCSLCALLRAVILWHIPQRKYPRFSPP